MKKTSLLLCAILMSISSFAQTTKVTRTFPAFTAIEASGAIEVLLRLGDKHEVVVVTEENFQERVELELEGNTLEISVDRPNWGNTPNVKVYVTVKELHDLDISGASSFNAKNTIRGNYLNVDASGASDVQFVAEVGLLDIEGSGASSVKVAGQTNKLAVDLSGASSIVGKELTSAKASIEMSGASSCKVQVTETISLEISGASDLQIKGDPKVEFKEVTGASSFSRM